MQTHTSTRTATPGSSPSPSCTVIVTSSETPLHSSTQSSTRSATSSVIPSPSFTETATSSHVATKTCSRSNTCIALHLRTQTDTPSRTGTLTSTQTHTFIHTATPSYSASPTLALLTGMTISATTSYTVLGSGTSGNSRNISVTGNGWQSHTPTLTTNADNSLANLFQDTYISDPPGTAPAIVLFQFALRPQPDGLKFHSGLVHGCQVVMYTSTKLHASLLPLEAQKEMLGSISTDADAAVPPNVVYLSLLVLSIIVQGLTALLLAAGLPRSIRGQERQVFMDWIFC